MSRNNQRSVRRRRMEVVSSDEPTPSAKLKVSQLTGGTAPGKLGLAKTRHRACAKEKWKSFLVIKALLRDAGRYFLEEDDAETDIRVFPWYSIYLLFAFTVWSRVTIASSPDSWWMVHPDEVFQSLEVAHSQTYGYGFRPYEFFLPPNASQALTNSERQHAALGMYSMRSWLYPSFYACLFWLRECFIWNMRPFQIAKMFHSIIAATLPLISYKFSKVVFPQKRDIAVLAAGFVAFSEPLMVLGTHTLIQSILSPFIFLSLTVIVKTAMCVATSCDNGSSPVKAKTHEMVIDNRKGATENNNFDVYDEDDDNFSSSEEKECTEEDQSVEHVKCIVQLVISGLILGIAVSVRLDSLFLIVVSVLCFVVTSPSVSRAILALLPSGFGFFCGTCLGGWSDYVNYGTWFMSSRQWVTFQVKYSSKLFGSRDHLTYFWDVLFTGHNAPGLTGLILGFGLVYSVSDYFAPLRTFFKAHKKDMQGWKRMFGMAVLMFVGYSSLNHKEVRFVHDAIVVYLLCAAATVLMVFKAIYLYIIQVSETSIAKRRFIKLGLYAELLLYMFAGRVGYPRASDPSSVMKWAYSGLSEAGQVNQCLDFIGRQSDVTGVFVDYSIHMTGAYTLLHQNVPIIAKTHFEFREWDAVSRTPVIQTMNAWSLTRNISINTIDRVSNFVTVQNVGLMVKYLISKPEYNYAITTGGRKLPKRGFREVFNVSDVWVFKRSRARIDRIALEDYGHSLPVGTNATVLEYEGSWLVTLQLYEKAVERLNAAVLLDSSRVRCWQLLQVALGKLERTEQSATAQEQCYKLLGRETCNTRSERVAINPEYEINL